MLTDGPVEKAHCAGILAVTAEEPAWVAEESAWVAERST